MTKEAQPTEYSWTEPASDYNTNYPFNNATYTESGHFQEFDDTPGAERIRIQHRTGTFTEVQADGSRINKIVGDNYEIVAKDNNVLIKGICNITVEGDAVMHVKGDRIERIKGNYYQEIEGNFQQVVKGEMSTTSGKDMTFSVGGALGTMWISAAAGVDVTGDMDVDGAFASESILSRNEITAGTGIHAGLPNSLNPVAGISTLGGVNVGMPGPTVPGIVTGTVEVQAPLISGVVVTDIKGPMELIRQLYDVHIHPTPKGPTGPPTPLM
jgi:hypothetical protein